MAVMTSLFKSYTCNECKSGRSFTPQSIETTINTYGEKTLLNKIIECSCGNKFSIYEGIIQNLVSDNIFSALEAVCDLRYHDTVQITVGKEYTVNLPRKLLINQVFLTNIDAGAVVAPNFFSSFETDSFTIVSSESKDNDSGFKKVGENHKVSWAVFGKSGDKPTETWILLLTQIKEQIIHGQYNIAVLTSEMMFESFLDKSLNKMLISEGLSKEASYTILESMKNIYDKAHKLLRDLNGKGLSSDKSINKEWVKLMELRNKIAHGENIDVDKKKAEWALKTALDAIFYIYMNSSVDIN
ncbi:hypothetical protein COM71_24255 [Priestia megaterium]|uniref:hypothetical protein n=1 Tax=Priestia megaterium TaxID=1404 RepID=UPI000BECFF04|nr:hypothetical protein [Priestia megaterium]PEE43830.1 hypothetical protein COM71_24255 [Priestia megaterium]